MRTFVWGDESACGPGRTAGALGLGIVKANWRWWTGRHKGWADPAGGLIVAALMACGAEVAGFAGEGEEEQVAAVGADEWGGPCGSS